VGGVLLLKYGYVQSESSQSYESSVVDWYLAGLPAEPRGFYSLQWKEVYPCGCIKKN